MTSSETQTVDREMIATDFREWMDGKLDKEKIDAAANAITSATGVYPAHGSLASLIFYVKVQVVINDGKTFDGNAGGAFTPGGGALFGDVYTDDINALYSNTHSFELHSVAIPVAYTAVLFFDGSSNLLGHFEAGAVTTVTGIGGGTGSWS
jgi:hypothetical protein